MVAKSAPTAARSTAPLLGAAAPALGLVLALSVIGCTSLPSPPSAPAYDTEVRPIFVAHCTRCHGAGPDGGSLNVPTETTGHNAGPALTDAEVLNFFAEKIYLTQFGTTGTCVPDNTGSLPADCRQGAGSAARTIPAFVKSARSAANHMPVPPAPDLNEYEIGVIDAWVAEEPNLICSNSPNPDPALHCP